MCKRCGKDDIMHVSGKCSDMYCGDFSSDGYVPSGLGIGGGDYIDFKLCLNCGQVQDTWPKSAPIVEEEEVGEEDHAV